MAGTTRDPVDELIELGGKTWRFVDTAGIRRRVHQTRGADYASLRTQTALEKAEVAVVLLDAANPLTEQDVRIISQVIEAGRGLVLAYNKWDLTDEERRYYLEREIERDLVQIPVGPGSMCRPAPAATWKLVPAIRDRPGLVGTRVPPGASTPSRRGRLGHPHPVRREAAAHPLRDPGRDAPPRFVVLPRASSRPGIAASSSAACARSSVSKEPRSSSRSGSARSVPAADIRVRPGASQDASTGTPAPDAAPPEPIRTTGSHGLKLARPSTEGALSGCGAAW